MVREIYGKSQVKSVIIMYDRGFAEDAEEEEEVEEDDDTENDAATIEASLNQSGDAGLLNIEAEKMAIEDQSKLIAHKL